MKHCFSTKPFKLLGLHKSFNYTFFITTFFLAHTLIGFSQVQIIPQCGFQDQTLPGGNPEANPNVSCASTLGVDNNFIPASTDAIKYIDVVLNVMQKEGPGVPENFSNTQTHKDFLMDIVNTACNFAELQNNDEPAYDGAAHPEPNHILDT